MAHTAVKYRGVLNRTTFGHQCFSLTEHRVLGVRNVRHIEEDSLAGYRLHGGLEASYLRRKSPFHTLTHPCDQRRTFSWKE